MFISCPSPQQTLPNNHCPLSSYQSLVGFALLPPVKEGRNPQPVQGEASTSKRLSFVLLRCIKPNSERLCRWV